MNKLDLLDQHDYGWEVPACSRRDLIRCAHVIHATFGYKGDSPFPILEFAENALPTLYEDYVFDIATEEDMGDSFGITYPDQHLIRIREDVYSAAAQGQGFARIVIAHECSHLLKHERFPKAMARRAASRTLPAYKSSEWQANALAGALLMPACKIVNLTVPEIINRYEVSASAAKTQLEAIRKEVKRWKLPQL